MLRLILTRGALFAAPFVAWFLWRAWAQRTGRPMGSTPWPWLFAVGAVLIGASLMAGAIFHRDNRDEVYVPAEATPSGAVDPGHFDEKGRLQERTRKAP